MPRIADFATVLSSRVKIQIGEDIDRDFDFPLEAGLHVESNAILAFKVLVPKEKVAFEVRLNGKFVGGYDLNYGITVEQTLHEIVLPNVLKSGTNNIEFKMTSGPGALFFGDIVLHYQRDI